MDGHTSLEVDWSKFGTAVHSEGGMQVERTMSDNIINAKDYRI